MTKILLLLSLIFTTQAFGATVKDIENYLNNMTHMTAKVTQMDAGGNQQYGNVYISKPGKLRLEYKSPKPLLIIFNGTELVYCDKEINSTSRYTNDNDLVMFLASNNISLSNNALGYYHSHLKEDSTTVSVDIQKQDTKGVFTLVFKKAPMTLLKVITHDDNGQKMELLFSSVMEHKDLDPKLFMY